MSEERIRAAICLFHGTPVDPDPYPATLEAWEAYVKAGATKLHGFEPIEFVKGADGIIRVPPPKWFPRLLLVGFLAVEYRRAAREPIRVRWTWRPEQVNKARGGAPASDHLTCSAADLQVVGCSNQQALLAQRRGEARMLELYDSKLLSLSLGTGGKGYVSHVGAFSPKGQRRWSY